MNLTKTKTERDKAYLEYIRTLPCSVRRCKHTPSIYHHVDGWGTGMKCSDYLTIPLCFQHHAEVHRGKKTFADKYHLDVYDIISTLAAEWLVAKIRE